MADRGGFAGGGEVIRYLDVCSGYSAFTQGAIGLPFECVGYAEIDAFPSALLGHHYGATRARYMPDPEAPGIDAKERKTRIALRKSMASLSDAHFGNRIVNFGDFTQIREDDVGPVDWLVGGTPCFPAGTLIATKRGLIPIEDVMVGDEALTHELRFRRVARVGSKQAETVTVKGQGHYGFVTTPDHPFLARQKQSKSTREGGVAIRKAWVTDPDWCAAKDMAGKHWACVAHWPEIAMPSIETKVNEHPVDMPVRDLMRLAGAYLGDGWVRMSDRRGSVMFGLNHSKVQELAPTFDAYGAWTQVPDKTTVRIQIASRPLARWLSENFGSGAEGKRVPMWVFGHPDRYDLLKGYLATDGGTFAFGYRATTVSPELALTMRMLAVSCGFSSSVGFTPRPDKHFIQGREVNQRDTYQTSFTTSARTSFEDAGMRWQLVRSVLPTGRIETVYDLEVEEDHSYVADGICVHNCQAFSIAGKRLGLDDPRGNLTLEFLALAKRVRAYGLVWENVPGFLSHDGGRTMGTFLGILGELGYGFSWRVLDAQYIRVDGLARAVPQRRKRLIVVGCLGDAARAAAILFEPESLRAYEAQSRSTRQGQDPADAELLPHLFNYIRERSPDVARIDTIKSSFRAWIGFLMQDELGTGATVADITPGVIARFRRWRMGPHSWEVEWAGDQTFRHKSEGVTGHAVQRNIEDLRAALNYAEGERRITAPKVPSVDKKHRQAPAKTVLTVRDLGAIVGYAREDVGIWRELCLMIATGFRARGGRWQAHMFALRHPDQAPARRSLRGLHRGRYGL